MALPTRGDPLMHNTVNLDWGVEKCIWWRATVATSTLRHSENDPGLPYFSNITGMNLV